MVVCHACGHAASEPAVGFVCLDCGSHTDSELAPPRDVYTYHLTDQGVGFAEHGQSLLGSAGQAVRFAELPLELVVALNAAAKKFNETREPFSLINIVYRNEREVVAQHGARAFVKARDLFIENLRSSLSGETDLVVKGQSQDFALVGGSNPDQGQGGFRSAPGAGGEYVTARYWRVLPGLRP